MKYKIFYDKANNQNRCTLINKKQFKNIRMKQISLLLKNTLFNKAIINGNELYLANNEIEVLIEDVNKCNVLFDILSKNYLIVRKAVLRAGKTKATSKFPLNIIRNQKILAGSLGLLALATLKLTTPNPSQIVEAAPAVVSIESYPIDINSKYMTTDDEQEITKLVDIADIKNETKQEIVNITHGTSVNTDKFKYAKDQYYELVDECASEFGLDTDLVMAVLTQESGGLCKNLMQFTFSAFEGEKITEYSYAANGYVTFFFTNDFNYQTCDKYIVIRENDLDDPRTNIRVACANIINRIKTYENINVGVMDNNQGPGNMKKIFKETYNKTGKTKEEIISNPVDLTFYKYAYASGQGDRYYLDDVYQYLDKDTITVKYHKDGIEKKLTIFFEPNIIEKTYQKRY